jgi:hypothetical protein
MGDACAEAGAAALARAGTAPAPGAAAKPPPQAGWSQKRASATDEGAGTSAAAAAPTAKRPRKPRAPKAPKAPPPPKRVDATGRTVRFAAAPSAKVRKRMARAAPGSGHRLFLLGRRALRAPGGADGAAAAFDVLGATGNVYTVTISRYPGCSCPDGTKGNVCKHRLFVGLRVLKLAADDPRAWQRGLLPAEADAALAGFCERAGEEAAPPADVVADPEAVRRWRASRAAAAGGAAPPPAPPARADADAECAICFEPLGAAEARIERCETCGNGVHSECGARWAAAAAQATCPYCRAPNPAAGGAAAAAGYTNLADASAAHRAADTSLEALYGGRAAWIQFHSGEISRREAMAAAAHQ